MIWPLEIYRWWPWWRGQNYFAPFRLPFMPSVTDEREWNIEVAPPHFTPDVPFHPSQGLRVSLHRILIEAGIALTPATSTWDPRSWYALYRYAADFAGTAPRLRFYEGTAKKDPRLSAIASEEVATGVTCYLLREHLEVNHIADVYACLQHNELRYISPKNQNRPDYFCETTGGKAVIAESKGAIGTRSNITSRIDPQGWAQVQNVAPLNLPLRDPCGRIVVGTHFCVAGRHGRSETTTILKDPEGDQGTADNPESDMVVRLAYGKVLRFMGQDAIAERLIYGVTPLDWPELGEIELPGIRGIPVFPFGYSPFGDVIGLYGPTAKVLLGANEGSVKSSINESLANFGKLRPELSGGSYGIPNGVVIIHDPDEFG